MGRLLGVLVGFIGAKVGWSRWLAHVDRGGVRGADRADPRRRASCSTGGTPGAQFAATADGGRQGLVATSSSTACRRPAQTGHHLLVLGLLVWATGQFAASAVFRHRRPLSAVVVIGAVLIGNMSATHPTTSSVT